MIATRQSSPTDRVRFPDPSAPSEGFQAQSVVIDDEYRHRLIPHHSGNLGADLIRERSRLPVDGVRHEMR